MSYSFQSEATAAFARCRSPWWRAVLHRAVDRIRASLARQRQRQELLEYLASDYRAAADIGVANYYDCGLREWPVRRG
ncbi:MAG: hypothetical protein WB764_10310 [Xanthobacteraceae bacterium]